MKRMPIAGLVALAVTFAVPAVAQTDEQPVTAETVLARVNGVEITAGHLVALRARLPEQVRQMPLEQLYDGLVDQLIDQELLSQTLDEVPRAIELRLENEALGLRANVILQQIVGAAVTDAAVEAAYEARYGDQEPEPEYNAAHILVSDEDAASALKAEIDAGADFAALAREHSTGPTGPNGGNLGWFGPGQMVAAFEAAVAALSAGEVSEPVETQFGWHLVKLLDSRVNAPPTLQDVRSDIEIGLRGQAVQDRLSTLREAGDMTIIETPDLQFLNDPSLFPE
jgi:peptidyl-prolyl cis-trans isomerase C